MRTHALSRGCVPTIRQSLPGYEDVIRQLRESVTRPTDLHVLEGGAGKARTLNEAYESLLLPSEAELYVTIDDDLLMPVGWQNSLIEAFDANPKWGALGLYLGDDQRQYMGLSDDLEPQTMNGIDFYPVGHVAGCLVAFPRDVASISGRFPGHPNDTSTGRTVGEASRRANSANECAYICAPDRTPTVYIYDDPPEYLASKRADFEASRPHVPDYLRIPAVSRRRASGAGVGLTRRSIRRNTSTASPRTRAEAREGRKRDVRLGEHASAR